MGHTAPFANTTGGSFGDTSSFAGSTTAGNGSGSGNGSGGSNGGAPSGNFNNGKKSGGVKTFLMGFAGAAVACVLALGGFALWQSFGSSGGGSTTLGSTSSSTIDVTGEDATLAEAVAAKCLPSVVAIDVYTEQSSMSGLFGMYGYGSSDSGELTESSLGSGVVINPKGILGEIDGLEARGVSCKNLRIDPRAHVIMPWHLLLDGLSEKMRGKSEIGTTKKGIGPCYMDKAERCGCLLYTSQSPRDRG